MAYQRDIERVRWGSRPSGYHRVLRRTPGARHFLLWNIDNISAKAQKSGGKHPGLARRPSHLACEWRSSHCPLLCNRIAGSPSFCRVPSIPGAEIRFPDDPLSARARLHALCPPARQSALDIGGKKHYHHTVSDAQMRACIQRAGAAAHPERSAIRRSNMNKALLRRAGSGWRKSYGGNCGNRFGQYGYRVLGQAYTRSG